MKHKQQTHVLEWTTMGFGVVRIRVTEHSTSSDKQQKRLGFWEKRIEVLVGGK